MEERLKIQVEPRYVKEEKGLRVFQKQTLEAIKDSLVKIIEVEAPVGAGKSHIIRRFIIDEDFKNRPIILTYPTTILMDAQVGALRRDIENIAIWPNDSFIPNGYNLFNYSSASLISYLTKNEGDYRLNRSELLAQVIKNLGFYSPHMAMVTSPDVLHLMINRKFYKGSKRLANFLQGCIVCFDEFHLYANLENFIRLVDNLLDGIAEKIILLSATPYKAEEFSKIERKYPTKKVTFSESMGDENDLLFNHSLDVEIYQFKYTDRNLTFEKLKELIPKIEKPAAIIFDSIFRLQHLKRRIQREFEASFKIIEWSGLEKERITLDKDTIVLGTSSIEVGIDMDFKTLITEVSYWTSAIQRIGRVGRKDRGKVIIFTRRDFGPYLESKTFFSRDTFEDDILKEVLKDPVDKLISSEMFRGESFNFILLDEELKKIYYYSKALFAMYEIAEAIDDWKILEIASKKELLSDWGIPKETITEIMLYDRIFPFWGLVKGTLRNKYVPITSKYDKEEQELYIVSDENYVFYGVEL